jgi:hypothetical protein
MVLSERKIKEMIIEIANIKRRRRRLFPEVFTTTIPQEPRSKSETDNKTRRSDFECFVCGVGVEIELSFLSPMRLINSTVVLILMIKRLSDRGFVNASFATSFMINPMNIKKAILSPTEKRAFSAISKFLRFSSFRITMPGTNIK